MNPTLIIDALHKQHYENIHLLPNDIIKCERLYNGRPYAITYIDISDEIPAHAKNVKTYQEHLVGPSFFSPDNSLRWNYYIYFIAGPLSTSDEETFINAKSIIESNRHFARKIVLNEEDFIRYIEKTIPTPEKTKNVSSFVNISSEWENELRAHSLGMVLEQKPRATTLSAIADGSAFKAERTSRQATEKLLDSPLSHGFLRLLNIGDFRRINNGKKYRFGDVNLITGPNGTGKTSLLEAIEAVYCGRVRRDLNAGFTGISAELEYSTGKLIKVETPTTTAAIKTRNMLWYGRADQQANAICQGFTRFNFLDTDAAFRLAVSNSEEIKDDVARLLVGAETSKLWHHLSALNKEIKPKIRSSDEQLTTKRRTIELLASEIKRVQEAPSEATVLTQNFLASLQKLRRHNSDANNKHEIDHNDKAWLEHTAKAITELLIVIPSVDVTASQAEAYVAGLTRDQAGLHGHAVDHENISRQIQNLEANTQKIQQGTSAIERWKSLLLADVPQLCDALSAEEKNISLWAGPLKGHFSEEASADLASEYLSLSIADAMQTAQANLRTATEQHYFASNALEQGIQLGETLDSLKRDLHDASISFINKSGVASQCPVCQTEHQESHLLFKLEQLVSSQNEHIPTGLRHNLQIAQHHLSSCQATLHSLSLLKSFCEEIHESPFQLVSTLHERRKQVLLDFQAASNRRQNILQSLEALKVRSFNWEDWSTAKADAIRHLPLEFDVHDRQALEIEIENLETSRRNAAANLATAREQLEQCRRSAMALASKYVHANLAQLPIVHMENLLQRKHAEAMSALEKIGNVLEETGVPPIAPLGKLRSDIEACIVLYDRARSAMQIETTARSELKYKHNELSSVNTKLDEESKTNENLARAQQVLSKIVENHSLDKATSMAFDAIKERVSDVFARIHSPHEYELGNFSEGQLLIRRDDKQTWEPHQVSTGQRAALALAIFLALNESAKSAPPIILIDDPVAHIDDLNALSFLDYLRELVVWNKKQVFFATADIRLAALFERKFDFLGDRFRRINITEKQN